MRNIVPSDASQSSTFLVRRQHLPFDQTPDTSPDTELLTVGVVVGVTVELVSLVLEQPVSSSVAPIASINSCFMVFTYLVVCELIRLCL